MFGYDEHQPRLPLAFSEALAVFTAEVLVEDAVQIEQDLLIIEVVLTVAHLFHLHRWQSGHFMDRPILLVGEGARVPLMSFL